MDKAMLLVVLATLGSKVTDFLKFLRNKDWNAAVTQLVVWASGAVVMFMASVAKVVHDVEIPSLNGVTFGSLDGGSKILVGTAITSLLSVGYDFKKALDNTDTAKTPPLMKG